MKNKTINRVWKMMKPELKTIIIISILAIIINIGEVARPYIIKIIIDDFLSNNTYQKGVMTIGLLGGIYLAIVLFGNILNFIVTTTTSMMGEKIIYSLRNKLYKYVQNANIPFHDKTPAGKLFVRITNDVEDVATLFKEVITTFIKDIIIIIALMIMMLSIDYKLALICFTILPFVIINSYVVTKKINRLEEHSKRVKTKLNTFLAESIYGVKIIKIFNRQYEKQREEKDYSHEFFRSRVVLGIPNGILIGVMLILENLAVAIIVWFCINKWLRISVGVGIVYMFITYTKQIFEPINRLVENFETVQEALVSIDKIYEILEHKEYLEDFESGQVLEKIEGKIEFKNVWFAYEDENWILKDISFTIMPGESIALVGKTGSGKTTITNLINRFYDIQKGEILLDGVNIKDINLRYLRKNIGIILQDPFIFARSIKDNIIMNEKLEDEEVEKTIALASAEDFVNSLPEGMDEISNERGNSYSAGQKQLLAFARIFAHSPSIFILDEATANIDTQTEELIQKSVDKISKEKTSIFIAHRLSTIINVDRIIVLDSGQIIEQGNHSELLQIQDGYYNKLYSAYYASLVS